MSTTEKQKMTTLCIKVDYNHCNKPPHSIVSVSHDFGLRHRFAINCQTAKTSTEERVCQSRSRLCFSVLVTFMIPPSRKRKEFSRRSPAVHPGEHKYVCADLGEKQKAKTNWRITSWFVVWQQCLTFCFPEPRKWVQRNNAPPLVACSSLRIWHHPGETKSDTSLVTASPKLQYFRACFYLFLHASSRAYKAKKRKKEKEDESTCNQAL